ncbi:MAG TPA: phosphotransferase [Stackebrandtia sp.]|jgi:aminoglycoside phosphotransferase (APT) family kinase protein|uniref:phosphotransferase n=1 Tax=Stackebrandtia sp. TaxID=2023065 RepID=UPI002D6CF9EA|nr:phosphotransferase [Stackebrandtia sp.]HZE37199.1 phosphotransferase [Stackebrandtia sp.]
MRFPLDKPVPYDATAVRPRYDTLPAAVRADIAAHLGGEPVEVRLAGGGFTGGFAARLTSDSGESMFVKAAGPHLPFVLNAYTYEAHHNLALPEAVPAPRLRFTSQVDEWVVLGFEAVDGVAPKLPLSPEALRLMLRAWADAADALTPAPRPLIDLGVEPLTTEGFESLGAIESGTEPAPPNLPDLAKRHLPELAWMEGNLAEAIQGSSVIHGDLRPDNMILGTDRAWICDWTMLNVAAPFFDTVAFLVLAHGDGHYAEGMFWEHPTAADVGQEQLDAVLAACVGYYLCNADRPLMENVSPYIRRHQRWNGLAALDWLASRRGW